MDHFLGRGRHHRQVFYNMVCVFTFYTQDKLGDIRCVVTDAFQVRHHLEGGGYLTQVAGNRLLPEDQGQASGLNGPLHVINRSVALDYILRHHIIMVLKCRKCLFNGAFHHVGHFL